MTVKAIAFFIVFNFHIYLFGYELHDTYKIFDKSENEIGFIALTIKEIEKDKVIEESIFSLDNGKNCMLLRIEKSEEYDLRRVRNILEVNKLGFMKGKTTRSGFALVKDTGIEAKYSIKFKLKKEEYNFIF